jgi:hypothetical protein
MFILGWAGWNGTPGDLNAAGQFTQIFTRDEPDPKLGPRASELAAALCIYDDGVNSPTYHVGYYLTPRIMIHASNEPLSAPLLAALPDIEVEVQKIIDYLADESWSNSTANQNATVPTAAGPASVDVNGGIEYLFDEGGEHASVTWPHLQNKLNSVDWDDTDPDGDVDAAHASAELLLKRYSAMFEIVPPDTVMSADWYHYDKAMLQFAAGRERLRELLIMHRLGLFDRPRSCISVVSETDWLHHYRNRNNFTVKLGYMDYSILNSFRVPRQSVNHFGPGSKEHM